MRKIVRKLKSIIQYYVLKKKWRKKNIHNFTKIKNRFNIDNLSVGKGTYGDIKIRDFGSDEWKMIIGNYCSIAPECTFLVTGNHQYDVISTFPWKNYFLNEENVETKKKGDILIGDDVWIGYGCLILSGVTIGQGAIIAAGSIVHKDVPPYAIYGGGRIIKYRFSREIIDTLLKIDFSKLERDTIVKNIENLYEKVTEENVKQLVDNLPLRN